MDTPLLLRPAIFGEDTGILALQTTRIGGCSPSPWQSMNLGRNTADDPCRVRSNLERLAGFLGLSPEQLIFTDQVHGTRVVRVDRPGNVTDCDALITATPGIFPAILTADCYPVLLHDPEHQASAAIHAGWQGTAGRIVQRAIAAMQDEFGTRPEACLAWIGTGISQEAYEVGAATAAQFSARHLRPAPQADGDKQLLDLAAANQDQLADAGIPGENIERSAYCSARHWELFFSYRRDNGQTGRMASLIGVRTSR